MEYIIESQNLVKKYKTQLAVNDVDIHVKKGDIYGLIGKNGAGKTTLLKLILGLTNSTSGKISLFNSENLNEERKKIGSLIEAPGLYKNCSAYENMLRFSILYGADKNEINNLLTKVGLADTGSKKVKEFSLGMCQRLGIAIALLSNPEILILDEPINGLDPAGIKDIRDIILDLHKEGITFVISSHLLDELAKIVKTYGIIANGRLIEEVSAKELKERCSNNIKIVTDNNEKALSIIKAQIKDAEIQIEDNYLLLLSHLNMSAQINALLVKNDISVSEITINNVDYEEYFIERLGR